MAEFTKPIGQATGASTPAARSAGGSGLADIFNTAANIAGGITQELADRKKAEQEQEKNSLSLELLNEQSENVESFFQSQDEQDLVEQGSEQDRQAALANPAVRTALNQIDKIGQASRQKSSKSDIERLYLNASTITRRVANEHPQHAAYVIAAAKKATGFDPIEKLQSLVAADAQFQTDLENKVTQDLVSKATQSGVLYLNRDGSVNQEKMIDAGLEINAIDKKIQLAKAYNEANPKIPLSDRQNNETRTVVSATSGSFNHSVLAFGDRIANLDFGGLSDQQQEAKVRELWVETKTAWLSSLNRWTVQNGVTDPKVAGDVRKFYEDQIAVYDEMFTGPQSVVNRLKDQVEIAKANLGLSLYESAPLIMKLNQAGGDQLVTSQINAAGVLSKEISEAIAGDFNRLVKGGVSSRQAAINGADFATGNKTIDSFSPEEQSHLFNGARNYFKSLAVDPNNATDSQLNTFGNMATQLAGLAGNTDDPKQLAAASDTFSKPSFLQLFNRFASDPNNKALSEALATNISIVNQKAISANARVLKDVEIFEFSTTLRPSSTGTTSPVYNTDTGRFEFEFSTTENDALGSRAKPNAETIRRLDVMNQALDALVALKDQVPGASRKMNEDQLRSFIATSTGVPVLGELPAEQPKPKQTSSVQNVFDIATEVALANDVPVDLVHAVINQESRGNQEAVSSAGAIGAMQLMPSTAADLGVDPYDARQNVEGGVKYLKKMLDRYDNDVDKALAAYNAGPGNVDKYDGIPPFPETQNYVKKIKANLNG